MRRIICDHCHTEVCTDEYGLAPKGWITLRTAGEYKEPIECCGVDCALAELSGRQLIAAAAARKAEAV